ncbi:MAG: peptidoglycan-binding domain-containing protein, partial [Ramlibacter sp.]
RVVNEAAAEVFPREARAQAPRAWPRVALAGGLGLAAGAGLLFAALPALDTGPTVAAVAPPAVVAPAAPAVVSVAVSAPAPAAPPPAPTLLRDEAAAWRELAQAWKLEPGEGAPCEQLQRQEVLCFTRTLDLSVIRQLGRPGIVTLDAATGQPSYAVLAALTDTTATLRAAGTEQTVTLAALAQRWQGEFGTLWRAPAGFREPPRDGDKGPLVDWVAHGLASARGAAAPKRRAVLDAALRSDVRAFQRAQGLPADGQPGPLTLMQLNRATGVDEPRLRTDS